MITRLVSRRGATLTLLLGVLLSAAVIGLLRGQASPGRGADVPATSESARVATQLTSLPDHDVTPIALVVTRDDHAALTPPDLAAAAALGRELAIDAPTNKAPSNTGQPAIASQDGRAALVQVPIRVSPDDGTNAKQIKAIRDHIAAQAPATLTVQVTGGPAFGADIAGAFSGANVRLLLTTVGIVALLLLLTYRSPLLMLVPLTVVGLADQLAAAVTTTMANHWGLGFDLGIISVLVFGAGTNYALLLISRYRDELRHTPGHAPSHDTASHRTALAAATRASLPAIVASNVTVGLSLAALLAASIPATRGLGVAAAVGLLIAGLVVLTLLPAALALTGRRIFWPCIPTYTTQPLRANGFQRIAERVMHRPLIATAASLAALTLLGAGLLGTRVGLTQTEQFRVTSESAAGLQTMSAHFSPGLAAPAIVTTDPAHATAVADTISRMPGATLLGNGTATGHTNSSNSSNSTQHNNTPAVLTVALDAQPGSAEARHQLLELRAQVHAVPQAYALVGGAPGLDVDARAGHQRDLALLVPLVLAIAAVILGLLLRSLVAPLVLLAVNAISAIAAIGGGTWLGEHLFGWPALDLQVPLLAFLFLVALGIDYTIFLVHRAKVAATTSGTRPGMVEAVGRTAGVITSAGIVLAAVFAALGVLPLVTLGQLGLIVGLGVLVDTFVVRTLLVPALFGLLGDRIWWPSRASAR